MRGWSLHQPWASLVARRLKLHETRGQAYPYRGLIAIHASRPWDAQQRETLRVLRTQFPDAMRVKWPYLLAEDDVPLSCFLAVALLESCAAMTPALIAQQSPLELATGDWRVGRYAYRLRLVKPLLRPEPAKGKQGLWKLDLDEYPLVAAAAKEIA